MKRSVSWLIGLRTKLGMFVCLFVGLVGRVTEWNEQSFFSFLFLLESVVLRFFSFFAGVMWLFSVCV